MKYILNVIISVCILVSCASNHIYSNRFYKLQLNSTSGAICSITNARGHEFISSTNADSSLFELVLRDTLNDGEVTRIYSNSFADCRIRQIKDRIEIYYDEVGNFDLRAKVTVKVSKDSPFMHWNIEIDNQTDLVLDYIDFPTIIVPNDLVGNDGDSRIFWPAQEGVLIENTEIRQNNTCRYRPIEYPNLLGWGGFYPSSAQTQFMAYYSPEGGLYLATHDDCHHPKGIEYCPMGEDLIKLEYHLFTSGSGNGMYRLPYDMVIGMFDGNWYDAAEIYRKWVESSSMEYPEKIIDNQDLPGWYTESPVIITYPVRGHKDMGDMSPNELYPYTNAITYIDKWSKCFDSKVMALLMHWEGSAPWAPPYAWPPYGDRDNFSLFVKKLHEKGNYVGLYASGIGYTLRSNTDTTYNKYLEFEELGLEHVMKKGPDQGYSPDNVCAYPTAQRIGYDMCPSEEFVSKVVLDQIKSIVNEGDIDYIQYFDQNLGGNCYACYSKEHNHPYGPGVWQNEYMKKLYEKIMPILRTSPRKPLLGCEAAAAEPFYKYLLFNDNRSTINLGYGIPVPAYQYINHEYINGFMGNQNSISQTIDLGKSPMSMLQRLAYAFSVGDMFTVIMRGNGDLIESWGASWEDPIPSQSAMISLIKNLNAWRKNAGKDFIVTGRMMKPLEFYGAKNIPMISKVSQLPIDFPSVFTSDWQSQDGRRAQFFVNYLPEQQTVTLKVEDTDGMTLTVDPNGRSVALDGKSLIIPPYSAVMLNH